MSAAFPGGGGPAGPIPYGVLFFLYWMGVVTGLKCAVAAYLPERRWHPRSAVARALLLAQSPDVTLAQAITVFSLYRLG